MPFLHPLDEIGQYLSPQTKLYTKTVFVCKQILKYYMYSNKYTNSTGGYLFQNCRLFYSFSGFEILQREGGRAF